MKATLDKIYFMLKKVKILGHITENKKTKLKDEFQKLEPPISVKDLHSYLVTMLKQF